MNHTTIYFIYRDGANYKYDGQFNVSGTVTKKQIKQYLDEGSYFLLGPLNEELKADISDPRGKAKGFPNDDDHSWLEFDGVERASTDAVVECTAKELLAALKKLHGKGWHKLLPAEAKTLGIRKDD